MMVLIGQYDSPFVRRVGIALTLYGRTFEHRPWSVFGDGARVQALNPLMRVPTLVLEDGFVLTDSHMMLDYLDAVAAEPMFPRDEPARHVALKRATLATGLAEKAVSLFYEARLHERVSDLWVARCRGQIGAVLAALEADRTACPGPWFGARLGHEDVALACALRFATEALPGVVDLDRHPALLAHCVRAEALAVFRTVYQPFVAPA